MLFWYMSVISPSQKTGWPVLERWDIPWDGKTTSLGMVAWLLRCVHLLLGSFLLVFYGSQETSDLAVYFREEASMVSLA